MEENRLQVMPDNYNVGDFEKLYKETKNLRWSLAKGINHHMFGYTPEDMYHEFDSKLIFAFQKYHDKYNYEIMKGHVIRALQLYRIRLLKIADNKKNQTVKNRSNTIDDYKGLSSPQEERKTQDRLDLIIDYMKRHLSYDAFQVFCVDMEPPLYIKSKMEELDKKPHSKVPSGMIAEYFEWGNDNQALQKVTKLRAEVKRETQCAIEYFNP
tara:strand:- start:76 stop:708 length:633 start_codon:yes stop_codon:yes gene_type:complete